MPRTVVLLIVCLCTSFAIRPTGAMALSRPPSYPAAHASIKVLSVTPRTLTRRSQIITVRVHYTGIVMDPLGMGKNSVRRHGHMQLYLDRIPSHAYQTPDSRAVVKVAATSSFFFVLSRYWWRAAHGRHTFLIALAQNNNVLYQVKPARFSLTVQ